MPPKTPQKPGAKRKLKSESNITSCKPSMGPVIKKDRKSNEKDCVTSRYFQSDSTASGHVASDVSKTKNRLDQSFYESSCEDLAEALLGQTLVCLVDGKRFI